MTCGMESKKSDFSFKDREARPDARIASLLSFLGSIPCRCVYKLVRK